MEGLVLLPRDRAPRPAADDRRHPRRPELGGQARASIPAPRCRSRRPAMPCSCRTIAAMSAGGRRSRRLNVGDPAGAEFEDILRRHRPVRRRGHRRSGPARRHRRQLWRLPDGLGGGDHRPLQGRRHGLRHRQPAELPLFLQPRLPANSSTAARSREERYRRVAIDRSPLLRLDKPTTPTLMIHGSEDRCTPLGQAQEFYAALGRARRRRRSSSSIRARATASASAPTARRLARARSPGSTAISGPRR